MATPMTLVDNGGIPVSFVAAEGFTGRYGVLAASPVAVSHTGSTAETVLATVAIPAGAMKLNGTLRVSSFWTVTANTNGKTMRHRLGGLAGTIVGSAGPTNNAANTNPLIVTAIMNRNSDSSQVARSMRNRVNDLLLESQQVVAAVNTAVAQDLVLTGQLGVGTDTITLEGYLVELIVP